MLKGKAVFLVVMSVFMLLVCLTSCKKEIVKPAKLEKKMVGNWDMTNHALYPYEDSQADGVVNLILNKEGLSTAFDDGGTEIYKFTYRVEGDLIYRTYFNEETQLPQNESSIGIEFGMSHSDTLRFGNHVYVRM